MSWVQRRKGLLLSTVPKQEPVPFCHHPEFRSHQQSLHIPSYCPFSGFTFKLQNQWAFTVFEKALTFQKKKVKDQFALLGSLLPFPVKNQWGLGFLFVCHERFLLPPFLYLQRQNMVLIRIPESVIVFVGFDLYKEIPRLRIFHIHCFQFFAINNKVSVDVHFSMWSFL